MRKITVLVLTIAFCLGLFGCSEKTYQLAWDGFCYTESGSPMELESADKKYIIDYVTDYDLRIYDPSGDLVSSTLTSSNVELVRLTAEETGTYRIVLYQWGSLNENVDGDWISLTIS